MRLETDSTGRQVTTAQTNVEAVFAFIGICSAICVGAAVAFLILLAIFGPQPASAAPITLAQEKNAFIVLNDACRGGSGDDPTTATTCAARDHFDAMLRQKNVCYQPQSATKAQSWAPCSAQPPDGTLPELVNQPQWAQLLTCNLFSLAGMRAAQDRDVGMPARESAYKTASMMSRDAQNLGQAGLTLIYSIPKITASVYASSVNPETASRNYLTACRKLSGL